MFCMPKTKKALFYKAESASGREDINKLFTPAKNRLNSAYSPPKRWLISNYFCVVARFVRLRSNYGETSACFCHTTSAL